jgi:hypothetical protein
MVNYKLILKYNLILKTSSSIGKSREAEGWRDVHESAVCVGGGVTLWGRVIRLVEEGREGGVCKTNKSRAPGEGKGELFRARE